MNPTPTLRRRARRSPRRRAQSATGHHGALATGVEDRSRNRALDRRTFWLAAALRWHFHQRRQRSQLQRPGAGARQPLPFLVEDGVASIGAQPVVYASEEAHHSLDKSVGLLGLGRKALRRIPVTDRYSTGPRRVAAVRFATIAPPAANRSAWWPPPAPPTPEPSTTSPPSRKSAGASVSGSISTALTERPPYSAILIATWFAVSSSAIRSPSTRISGSRCRSPRESS